MHSKQKFSEEEFTKLLYELNVITFRYNVISGLHTNEIEQVFNKLSIKIFSNDITKASQAFEMLKSIYVADESFAQKLLLYKSSKFRMSNTELNYTEWTPIILRKHQDKMAKWACSAWKSYYQ